MKYPILLALLCCTSLSLSADDVVWSGQVTSDGTPSSPVKLTLNENYEIIVSGFVNLGKWVQAGEKLATDACFEFNQKAQQEKVESFKNSLNISVCDGTYHADHIYTSKAFVAKQNLIHFWVYDTDYEDNNGAFNVQVIHKSR